MSQPDLLRYVVRSLEDAGIGYLVTGSIASSLQGEPRSTHDLDVVVAVHEEHIAAVLAAFPRPRFYVDEGAVREAVRDLGMFNVIHILEGDKVDFWMLTDEPFDRSRFGRRIRQRVLDLDFYVSSPEDTILAKLRWSRMSGESRKPYMDALRVYEVQRDQLDLPYLHDWATALDVADLLTRLRAEAVPF